MSQRTAAALMAVITLALTLLPVCTGAQQPASVQAATAQAKSEKSDEIVRRAKSKVQPVYPELARKMGITGTVKIEVVVAPNGSVKDARVVGGHPVLAGVALDAARKWRFDPAAAETSGVIDFKFEPR